MDNWWDWREDFKKWLQRKGACTCRLKQYSKQDCFECYKKMFHPDMVFPELNSITQFEPFLAKNNEEKNNVQEKTKTKS